MDRAILFNYFLVPERCARKLHRLDYTYKLNKLSRIMIIINTKNHHGIFIIASILLTLNKKRYAVWERFAFACAIQVYQNLGTLIIIV